MNKKSLSMLLLALMVGISACTDKHSMSMEVEDRTYVNECKSLVDAVNNLSSTIADRFDALADLLKKGIEDIKLSIDANTGAIKVLSQDVATLDKDMKEGLSAINTTLFNGFNSVCTQIDATGKTIVAAIDNNGNLLRLKIDETGKLLAVQILTSTDELVKVMKESTTTLAEKLGLIDAAISAGFADQNDAQNATIAAINTLRDKTISGVDIKAALDEIKKAISDDGVSISTKLIAIEAANNAGLSTIAENTGLINSAIGTLTNQVSSGTTSITTALGQIKAAISNDEISLASKIELVQQAITTGFTDLNGATGSLQTMTDALKTAIEGVSSKLTFGEGSDAKSVARYLSEMVGSLNNINETMGNTNTKLEDIRQLIEKKLADNGVTIDGEKSILVTPEIWAMIESSGASSALYKVFYNAIKMSVPPYACFIVYPDGSTESRYPKSITYTEGSLKLFATTLEKVPEANNKTIIRVRKVTSSAILRFTMDVTEDRHRKICCVRVTDNRVDYQVWGKETGDRSQIGEGPLVIPDDEKGEASFNIKYKNEQFDKIIKIYTFTYIYPQSLPESRWPSDFEQSQ